jgi:transposase
LEPKIGGQNMTFEGAIVMSQQELQRVKILEKILDKKMKQREACKILSLSRRQIIRLLKKYRRQGVDGLLSQKRGKPSNNRFCEDVRKNVLAITKEKYADFGPTFLQEKLVENHAIEVSKETLRTWMIAEGIWEAKRRKAARIHQSRERRDCFGELIQIDGSPHDWFEGRREKCCLLVFIDDATSRLVNLRFEESETTAGYFRTMREYVTKFGLPMALYSDRHSIFRINMPETKHEGLTQFERAMKELGVETICANSPQAKGRVERANGILQDRLIKEMRLHKINDLEAANTYLPKFIESYNKKFAVEPKNSVDAHVKLKDAKNLNLIFSFQNTRTLSKNLEMSYNSVIYQVKTDGQGYGLRHAKTTVCEDLEGKVTLIYKGKKLNYSCYEKRTKTAEIVEAKTLNHKIDSIVKRIVKPSADHPWRHYPNRFAAAPQGI